MMVSITGINWLVVSTPLKNMKVSWDYYSHNVEKYKMFQTTNQIGMTIWDPNFIRTVRAENFGKDCHFLAKAGQR